MKDKLMQIAALLEQMSVTGERNALIYINCLREIKALANQGDAPAEARHLSKAAGGDAANAAPEAAQN